jgi:hypothetical protein
MNGNRASRAHQQFRRRFHAYPNIRSSLCQTKLLSKLSKDRVTKPGITKRC